MKHRFLLGLLCLCLAALLCGCGQQPVLPETPVIPSPEPAEPEIPAPPEEPDAAFGVDPDPLPEELDDAFSV